MEGLKIAKLTSGEFIIGRIVNCIFTNVFKLNTSFDQITGVPNVTLLPLMWPLSNNVNLIISMDKCICIDDPNDKVSQLYIDTIMKFAQENVTERIKETEEEISKIEEHATDAPEIKGGPEIEHPEIEIKDL